MGTKMKIKNSLQSIKTFSITLIVLSLSLVSVCFAGEDVDMEQQLKNLHALSNDKVIKSEVKTQPVDMTVIN
jgi:hypothetical protein